MESVLNCKGKVILVTNMNETEDIFTRFIVIKLREMIGLPIKFERSFLFMHAIS